MYLSLGFYTLYYQRLEFYCANKDFQRLYMQARNYTKLFILLVLLASSLVTYFRHNLLLFHKTIQITHPHHARMYIPSFFKKNIATFAHELTSKPTSKMQTDC